MSTPYLNETPPPAIEVLTELNHVFLVAYSALNSIAYCGDLVLKKCFRSLFGRCLAPCRSMSGSNIEVMESYRPSLLGGDPMEDQLRDLDPQSRILSGLSPNTGQEQVVEARVEMGCTGCCSFIVDV